MPNAGRERCMAYAVLGTGLAWDGANFPPLSLWNGLASLPEDPEERMAAREATRSCFRFWSELRERETDELPAGGREAPAPAATTQAKLGSGKQPTDDSTEAAAARASCENTTG